MLFFIICSGWLPVMLLQFCPWVLDRFVVGYDNGLICLFDAAETNPIRRFYDMKHMQSVLSVAWMKSSNAVNGEDILLYGLFEDGIIRFLDFKVNQETQSYIFEKQLATHRDSAKSKTKPCCESINSFIAMSNAKGSPTFSIHRISI